MGRKISYKGAGKVSTAHCAILKDIATDISQLHGNPKVDGIRIGCWGADIKNTAHHEAYGAGHAVAVADEFIHISDPNLPQIRGDSIDKFKNRLFRNTTLSGQ